MKKSKIEYGQCYTKEDHVFMVVAGPYDIHECLEEIPYCWDIQDTLTKMVYNSISESEILTWRRSFDNWE